MCRTGPVWPNWTGSRLKPNRTGCIENGTGSNRLRAKIYQSNFEPDRIERITIPNRIEPVFGS